MGIETLIICFMTVIVAFFIFQELALERAAFNLLEAKQVSKEKWYVKYRGKEFRVHKLGWQKFQVTPIGRDGWPRGVHGSIEHSWFNVRNYIKNVTPFIIAFDELDENFDIYLKVTKAVENE